MLVPSRDWHEQGPPRFHKSTCAACPSLISIGFRSRLIYWPNRSPVTSLQFAFKCWKLSRAVGKEHADAALFRGRNPLTVRVNTE
jgi:hypothetical protein